MHRAKGALENASGLLQGIWQGLAARGVRVSRKGDLTWAKDELDPFVYTTQSCVGVPPWADREQQQPFSVPLQGSSPADVCTKRGHCKNAGQV